MNYTDKIEKKIITPCFVSIRGRGKSQRLFDTTTLSTIPITKANEKEYRKALVKYYYDSMFNDNCVAYVKNVSGFSDEKMREIYKQTFDVFCNYLVELAQNADNRGCFTIEQEEIAERVKDIPYANSLVEDFMINNDVLTSVVNYSLLNEHKEVWETDLKLSLEIEDIVVDIKDTQYPKVKTNEPI